MKKTECRERSYPMEDKISFQSGDLKIEGLLGKGSSRHGVVITHPHTLFGGDMYNVVVESLVTVYQQKGFTTLRFNFRGAGKSQGSFDQGTGEQMDVMSAISWMKEHHDIHDIDLAGYSFGAWVNALVSSREIDVGRLIMVAPPVAFIDFKDVKRLPGLFLVVSGSEDEYAPPEIIRELLPTWNPTARLEIMEGGDHFFFGHSSRLEAILNERL
ncbi:MAG: alpha/beta hydrolase [Desulfobacteraceae bacterium]|nr:MAG: alpha/beta hydrolase [Desulfobacteraceae bacterium]